MLLGVQESEDTPGCVTCALVSPSEKLRELPFKLAVNVAEVSELTAVGALAVKVALEDPLEIETEMGTVTSALLLDNPTLAPDAAAPVRLTVHEAVPGGVRLAGVQVRLESTGEDG